MASEESVQVLIFPKKFEFFRCMSVLLSRHGNLAEQTYDPSHLFSGDKAQSEVLLQSFAHCTDTDCYCFRYIVTSTESTRFKILLIKCIGDSDVAFNLLLSKFFQLLQGKTSAAVSASLIGSCGSSLKQERVLQICTVYKADRGEVGKGHVLKGRNKISKSMKHVYSNHKFGHMFEEYTNEEYEVIRDATAMSSNFLMNTDPSVYLEQWVSQDHLKKYCCEMESYDFTAVCELQYVRIGYILRVVSDEFPEVRNTEGSSPNAEISTVESEKKETAPFHVATAAGGNSETETETSKRTMSKKRKAQDDGPSHLDQAVQRTQCTFRNVPMRSYSLLLNDESTVEKILSKGCVQQLKYGDYRTVVDFTLEVTKWLRETEKHGASYMNEIEFSVFWEDLKNSAKPPSAKSNNLTEIACSAINAIDYQMLSKIAKR